MLYSKFRSLFVALTIAFALIFSFGTAKAQVVKAEGISNVWRGNWDNREDLWNIMTVRMNSTGKAEIIFINAQFKPYYNAGVEVKDGKSFDFTWGKSKLEFTLQPDGTLKGKRTSSKEENEITMTTAPKDNGIAGVWEGIWGGQGQFWTVMSIQTNPEGATEVMMSFVNGTPFYSNEIELKGGKSFDFKWGTVDHTFTIQPNGTLEGVRNWNGQKTPITLKKMFLQ